MGLRKKNGAGSYTRICECKTQALILHCSSVGVLPPDDETLQVVCLGGGCGQGSLTNTTKPHY